LALPSALVGPIVARMKAIIGDVLIDRVVGFGLLLATVAGGGLAALAGLLTATDTGGSMSRGDVIACSVFPGIQGESIGKSIGFSPQFRESVGNIFICLGASLAAQVWRWDW